MPMRYELRKLFNGQYFFTLHSDNNEKILTSEFYKAKPAAQEGIAAVKANSAHEARYEHRTSSAGRPYFVLKAADGEIIGTGEEYDTQEAMENGMAAVRRVGPAAPIQEHG